MIEPAQTHGLLSFRTLLSSILITLGVLLLLLICLFSLAAPCITNFYGRMPVYPSATLTESTGTSLNYIGIGIAETVWITPDERQQVSTWYRTHVDEALNTARLARVAGEEHPPTWNHDYMLQSIANGTEITLTARCLN